MMNAAEAAAFKASDRGQRTFERVRAALSLTTQEHFVRKR
jgi:hypothetical protein